MDRIISRLEQKNLVLPFSSGPPDPMVFYAGQTHSHSKKIKYEKPPRLMPSSTTVISNGSSEIPSTTIISEFEEEKTHSDSSHHKGEECDQLPTFRDALDISFISTERIKPRNEPEVFTMPHFQHISALDL
ncbi:hypothetical protein ADUPG1_007086 [Aduncisulcus paluster]|uniref:Uncharacterized protein n=1 Tax=Aduncisulcus paluster TaxID=2918883 RepID=A0ABQ5KNM6_9EUKA|nr:hypothetical protein ADUPG1_007086 [Aduncisulcus paluster]